MKFDCLVIILYEYIFILADVLVKVVPLNTANRIFMKCCLQPLANYFLKPLLIITAGLFEEHFTITAVLVFKYSNSYKPLRN